MLKLSLLLLQNLARNPVRTALTMLGTIVLVVAVTFIWSILTFLDEATAEKNSNLKAIVSEQWRVPSQMPQSYARPLQEGAARDADDYKVPPQDSMTWSFFGGSLDPASKTFENAMFAFCLEPDKLLTMMDELDELQPEPKAELATAVERMKKNRRGAIVGRGALEKLKKQVGDRIVLHGINYKDINLELEIVGTFPEGRYDPLAAINIEYLIAALDVYKREHRGTPHPLEDKTLNLVWLRVPDMATFQKVSQQISESPSFTNPAVKIETQAAGIGTWMEAYRDLIWAFRFLIAPAIIATLASIIANAISISVRERQLEFAVMKVLGFRPNQRLGLVIGESLLLGGLAGLIGSAGTLYIVNNYFGGIKFPIAFFGIFMIPTAALIWGPAIGVGASFIGSFLPAWSARSVKAAEVFAKVA